VGSPPGRGGGARGGGIRWPDWPARTIRASIPYMVEHEDSHVDQIRHALGRD